MTSTVAAKLTEDEAVKRFPAFGRQKIIILMKDMMDVANAETGDDGVKTIDGIEDKARAIVKAYGSRFAEHADAIISDCIDKAQDMAQDNMTAEALTKIVDRVEAIEHRLDVLEAE